ncbi:hypothetical protein DSCA_33990 [Desulfosarcina alkanivorans]|uniref:Uncharacterized protein n=1 Tax=Desulfosarcina alkanivorans TaxID=571177 RepID=A0A5K7YNM1_9BACT|nr:hypothetical protein [Desulfosarcina alkanivorans]BBO69469.1 hypothetical protein DSCA_33990 [Desulfosarcina alkanivorans]
MNVTVPQNKFIITFCLTGFRAAMGDAIPGTRGFDAFNALKDRLDEMAGAAPPSRSYRLTP